MAKRSIHHSLLPYCLVLLFLPLCFSYSCRGGLRNYMSGAGNSTWKLCLLQTRKQVLRFKIKGLIQEKRVGWLSMGFPQKNQKTIPSFVLKVTQSNSIVQQTEAAKKEVSCSLIAKGHRKMVSVDCYFGDAMNEYVKSKKIQIFWNTGAGNVTDVKSGQNLLKNHSVLYLYIQQRKKQPPENAGSTAMRLLRNYGKSMGAIFGISFVLTALITLTICCCCKKKIPRDSSKEKISKNSSVSFYRDESEGDGQSDESGDDEKVAFIRNNNDRNSSV